MNGATYAPVNNMSQMSQEQLRDLAAKATKMADDMSGKLPSYDMALEAGVQDCGYSTVRYGWVNSYRGTAVVTMADGRQFQCVGHKPQGGPDFISQRGFIEFFPMQSESPPLEVAANA